MKKALCLLLACVVLLGAGAVPASAQAAYGDVPAGSWCTDVIEDAARFGLMEGVGGGDFGYGRSINRAEFVTILCRMFSWELPEPASPSFSDVAVTYWAYPYVEAALAHGVLEKTEAFRPLDPILRGEMAVMLVRALGYGSLAQRAERFSLPFTDVTENRGYIAVAYDIGMTSGTSAATFSPSATAKREECAAMLVRVYRKLQSRTEWLHGFYAFSSWPQHALTREMDAGSAGWSRLSYDASAGVSLLTSNAGGNEWSIPDSYESLTGYLDEGGTPLHLNVYMAGRSTLDAVLLSPENRAAAIDAILHELSRPYAAIGKNPYAGVTLDFEGLKGSDLKAGYNAFLIALSDRLKSLDKRLYVAVQPATEGEYFDGFDYRTIGETADKVILMAHDYAARDFTGFEGTAYYKTAAPTPISDVYYSLRAVTDPATGVADSSKLALAVSFANTAWEIQDGKLLKPSPFNPSAATVYARLRQPDTQLGWSEEYQNPWAVYTTESGQTYFLWYEDARSVEAKHRLTRLVGSTGGSAWRLGESQAYGDAGLNFDAWAALR
jgi:hypothetical protein